MVRVLKFGGTSMANMERVLSVVDGAGPCVLVVSALGKATDMLRDRDFEGLRRLFCPYATRYRVQETVDLCLDSAERGGRMPSSDHVEDWVLSYGEKTTAYLLQAAIELTLGRPAMVCDDVTVQGPHGDARVVSVNLPDADGGVVRIVPGFYGYDTDAIIKTIGRSGSDIMAAAVAKHVGAREVIVYTDVHGIFSADPRKVASAVCFEEMHSLDAIELGFAGGNVLHPRTVQFLLGTGIDLIVRHVEADAGGTLVNERTKEETHAVAVKENQVLLSVEDTTMHAVPGIVAALFRPLEDAGVSVSFITQSCSETCVTFAVDRRDVDKCAHLMGRVSDVRPVAIVSLVGGSMRARVGVAGAFFQALATANVNVLAIGQGATERSISAVVADTDAPAAMEVVNDVCCARL
jgi:aspartate kinase